MKVLDFVVKVFCKCFIVGMVVFIIFLYVVMCIVVGKVLFEDCDLFILLFGWIIDFLFNLLLCKMCAWFVIILFMFIFDCVLEFVC